jgi:hypothetical protein
MKNAEMERIANGVLLAQYGLTLVDRADGCKGHYCIRRYIPDTNEKYVEHWNEGANKWSAFGTLYTDLRQALGQAWLIIGTNDEYVNKH